ncbi:hypothetical protein CLV24_11560 [Pontibacter ummariensis]|uniref:Uncharacterized protein n=1 Tax=Pontibacter ummariensis TaxID=1610492 RepID=A0A239I0A0_9BACT|nr:hypothetical protein CLV24_11560 [Pontibacter ummariensis]SNS86822.1 hypothetical protein SAMN06296052_11560 [Pontibacter ummariensis]
MAINVYFNIKLNYTLTLLPKALAQPAYFYSLFIMLTRFRCGRPPA